MRKTIIMAILMLVGMGMIKSVGAACDTAECVQAGLWGAYNFNETAGANLTDWSGNSNFVLVAGTAYNWSNTGATDSTGTAMCIDGSNSHYMYFKNNPTIDADFMVCGLRLANVASGDGHATPDSFSTASNSIIWGGRADGMAIYQGAWDGNTDGAGVPKAVWDFSCFVSQGNGGDLIVRNDSVTKNFTATISTGSKTCLGGGSGCHGDFLDGCWDEFYFWDTATNWSEKADYLYNSGDYKTIFTAEQFFPPVVSNFNCTSCNPPFGDNSSPYTTGDTTPTFTFDTDLDADCRIADVNWNYTYMNATRDCATTGGTSHVCSILSQDSLTTATDYAYVACTSSGAENVTSSTPGGLEVNLSSVILGGSGDVRGFATQYLEVLNKTTTEETLNLTVQVFNPEDTEYTNVNITPPTGFGGGVVISVSANSSNSVSFLNRTTLKPYDGGFVSIAGSVLVGDVPMTTNTIRRYIPVANQTWNYLSVNSGCMLTISSGGNLTVKQP